MRVFQWRWKSEGGRPGTPSSWQDGCPPEGSNAAIEMGHRVESRWVEVLTEPVGWHSDPNVVVEDMRAFVGQLEHYVDGPLRCPKSCTESNLGLPCLSNVNAMAWKDKQGRIHVHSADHLLVEPAPVIKATCRHCGSESTIFGRVHLGPCRQCGNIDSSKMMVEAQR
jgi:hypothetical protein